MNDFHFFLSASEFLFNAVYSEILFLNKCFPTTTFDVLTLSHTPGCSGSFICSACYLSFSRSSRKFYSLLLCSWSLYLFSQPSLFPQAQAPMLITGGFDKPLAWLSTVHVFPSLFLTFFLCHVGYTGYTMFPRNKIFSEGLAMSGSFFSQDNHWLHTV